MRVIAIIPARYASTRFPGKPLALLGDKPIIEWVYRSASQFFSRVVVATDDRRIADVVEAFGGEALMTSNKHRCGTERCAEALSLLDEEYDVVVNIQGDEPFITVGQMQTLIEQLRNPRVDIATLATPIDGRGERVDDPNIVKVVISQRDTALYFSRSVIPYLRGVEPKDWTSNHTYYRHVGVYAFRGDVLKSVVSLAPTRLEMAEGLEQLRWLDNGYVIGVGITTDVGVGIDTPEDLCRAEEIISNFK